VDDDLALTADEMSRHCQRLIEAIFHNQDQSLPGEGSRSEYRLLDQRGAAAAPCDERVSLSEG
jgi:hypothetical protein